MPAKAPTPPPEKKPIPSVISFDSATSQVKVDHLTQEAKANGESPKILKEEQGMGEIVKVDLGSTFKITFSLDRKISDGNYGSIGVFVGLSAPSNLDDLDGDFEEVTGWVKARIEKEIKEIRAAVKK